MNNTNRSTWLGIILVAIGALLIMDEFGLFFFNLRHLIFSWHTLFLIIGVIILSKSKNSMVGIIFLVIGLFGIAGHILRPLIGFALRDFWPLIIIIIGLYIILKRNNKKSTYENQNYSQAYTESASQPFSTDLIDETTLFTSAKKSIASPNFRGGKVTTMIGSTHIDLSQSELSEGENILEVTTVLGECILVVPRNWKIITNVTSIFGGFDDKRYVYASDTHDNAVLIIKGTVLFAGSEIIGV